MVDRDTPVSIRVSRESREAYDRAAMAAGLSRTEWIRLVLDAASGQSDLPSQMMRILNIQNKSVEDGEW